METIDSLKKTISSTKDIKQVIKTMKSLAMANVKNYIRAVDNLYFYKMNLENAIHGLVKYGDFDETELFFNIESDKSKKKNLIIIFGSNQGLCGRFNDRIKEFLLNKLDKFKKEQKNEFIVVGNRLDMLLRDVENFDIVKSYEMPNTFAKINLLTFEIIKFIEKDFKEKKLNKVFLYYTANPENSSNGVPYTTQLFSMHKKYLDTFKKKNWLSKNVPVWNVDIMEMLTDILKQYIFISLNNAFFNSVASELKNRLITLQNAEKNIDDIIKTKQLEYNQKRQLIITSQLLDVISGWQLNKKNKV
ncbi:MAG: hypothetical protein Ta2D_09120 [Rickettsiales bacterium]|nr:MAG: hypothetical protein Ta2D_09120 [Rickettsiales bacterium]